MIWASRRFGRFSCDAAGSAAVEFALTIPVLLLLLLGIAEFGRLMWTQNSIQYAVEQAARCAAFKLSSCGNAAQTQTYAASLVHGYTAVAAEFTVTYGACGVTGTTGVLVSASVPFTSLLSPRSERPLESHLAITLTGQSCRPMYS
jgi:Flp pilus assembly protein TadG